VQEIVAKLCVFLNIQVKNWRLNYSINHLERLGIQKYGVRLRCIGHLLDFREQRRQYSRVQPVS
jgi:hypothetical protein